LNNDALIYIFVCTRFYEKRKVESKFKRALIKGSMIKEVSVSSTKVYIVGDELEIEMLG